MKFSLFLAKRITGSEHADNSISSPAVKIGMIAVSMGVAIMILTVSVIRGFKNQITTKLKNLTSDVIIMPYQSSYDITSHPLSISDDSLSNLKKFPFISDIEPVCIKNGILKIKEENEGVVFKGVNHQFRWQTLEKYLIEGQFPTYSDTSVNKEIIISKKLADKIQIKLHQKIIIYFITKIKDDQNNEKIDYKARDFYVKGIIHPEMGELDNQLIYGDLKIIQKINNWNNNEYSQIEIYGQKGISGSTIVEKIIDFLPYNYKIITAEELYSNIFNWLEMIDINAVIIIVLMLIVAAVNMVSALIILILEKVNVIGILKALGMNNNAIKNIFLFVSIKILFWGLLWGNVVSLLLIFLQDHYHFFSLDPNAYYVNYIPVEWNVWDWILLNAGTTFNCLLFMFLPTFIISRMYPSQILRWE
ncbi:MAG: ABC transporter permease [Bacteroidia bacterium]|nr:ABC transporter permease [Bacteroidia bacterium]